MINKVIIPGLFFDLCRMVESPEDLVGVEMTVVVIPGDERVSDMPETNEYGQTFEEWKTVVSGHVEARCGLGCDDLPDYCYRDMFEDGIPSDDEDMLDEILENAGW